MLATKLWKTTCFRGPSGNQDNINYPPQLLEHPPPLLSPSTSCLILTWKSKNDGQKYNFEKSVDVGTQCPLQESGNKINSIYAGL